MGFFDVNTKEKRTMLYFKENGHFKFEIKPVEDTFLLEKKNGRVVRAWEDLRKLRLPFSGWRNIPRDEVTLAHSRDVIFDPFHMLNPKEKPTGYIAKLQGNSFSAGVAAWISDITRTQQYKRQGESSKRMAQSTQALFLGVATAIFALAAFIVVVVNLR